MPHLFFLLSKSRMCPCNHFLWGVRNGGTLPRLLFAASGLSRQPCIFASSGVSGLVVVNYVLGGLNCWPLTSIRIHLQLQTHTQIRHTKVPQHCEPAQPHTTPRHLLWGHLSSPSCPVPCTCSVTWFWGMIYFRTLK